VWHHFQYLAGLRALGHEVFYFEHYGWRDSCYDPSTDTKTSDPRHGIACLRAVLEYHALEERWCYLAEDGTAYGMSRECLAHVCRSCDVYLNLSNINWIPELELCRRRVLVDTDPVFTQIGAVGATTPDDRHHVFFTYGENVHRAGCDMPTAGRRWLPTRQPVVLDLWPVAETASSAPFTTVTTWEPLGDHHHEGRTFGGKAREFEAFLSVPRDAGQDMEIALTHSQTRWDGHTIVSRLAAAGWHAFDAIEVTRTPWDYQSYLRRSRAEFCVAKHGYVSTRCGWFSERSAGYLASGRPVVVQDTGFSDFLPCGAGLLPFRDPSEALQAIRSVVDDYDMHCRAARALVEEYFDARCVLTSLLERAL
jgi:hypothetical protein